MKLRLWFLASMAIAVSLALVGVLKDVTPTRAVMPQPVQPFAADAVGGVDTTLLGVGIGANYTVTLALQGERTTLPWIFSAPGFSVDKDGDGAWTPDGNTAGTVYSTVDADCNGGAADVLMNDCDLYLTPAASPLIWVEAPTGEVVGTPLPAGDQYLKAIMPPWKWLFRHKVDIDHLCFGTTPLPTKSVLNTVYAEIPFSGILGQRGFVAQTQLGGAPDSPPGSLCLDSPQSSTSITTPYNNPPAAGGSGVIGGAGLYARWTIFRSQGNSQLARPGDLRKVFKSPPSIASDTGYVERTIDLQCFWMDTDGCFTDAANTPAKACDKLTASPPGNGDDIISEVESWNDYDLVNLAGVGVGGIDQVDTDGDCLADPVFTSQLANQPLDGTLANNGDVPTGDLCQTAGHGWVKYSADPKNPNPDTAADSDCDGLLNGIEVAYGSNPNAKDSDTTEGTIGGTSNPDGAPDFVEMFQFTNPLVRDSDLDGYLDKPAGVYVNDGTGRTALGVIVPTDTNVDNCPTVANADQANNDGKPRDNGPQIGGLSASNPAQDKIGDACDTDDDNDDAVDGYETSNATPALRSNPLKFDTDGDTIGDGAEWRLGPAAPNPNTWPTNPSATTKPAWTALQQTYYRGCNIAVNESYTGFANAPTVGNPDGREMDVDGDGILCPTDLDADNGGLLGDGITPHANKDEIIDSIEAYGYGTYTANPDTDGDGCEDWCEISDLNGDRRCDIGDFLLLTLRKIYPAAGSTPPDAVSDIVFDVDRNTKIDVGDQLQEVLNSYGLKAWGGGPLCPNEN